MSMTVDNGTDADTTENANRIAEIHLDECSVVKRSPEIEMERHRALSDLLAQNSFAPKNTSVSGPYRLKLAIAETRLEMQVLTLRGEDVETLSVPLKSFSRIVKDYFMICESFYEAAKKGLYSRLESLDMGRRGLHDEGAELLIGQIEDRIALDKPTARRIFTLICVLHIRLIPVS